MINMMKWAALILIVSGWFLIPVSLYLLVFELDVASTMFKVSLANIIFGLFISVHVTMMEKNND